MKYQHDASILKFERVWVEVATGSRTEIEILSPRYSAPARSRHRVGCCVCGHGGSDLGEG